MATPQTQPDEPAWTTADVLRVLNLKEASVVHRLAKAKKIRGAQLGKGRWRFDPASVRAFLRGDPQPAAERTRRKPRPDDAAMAALANVPRTFKVKPQTQKSGS